MWYSPSFRKPTSTSILDAMDDERPDNWNALANPLRISTEYDAYNWSDWQPLHIYSQKSTTWKRYEEMKFWFCIVCSFCSFPAAKMKKNSNVSRNHYVHFKTFTSGYEILSIRQYVGDSEQEWGLFSFHRIGRKWSHSKEEPKISFGKTRRATFFLS
jgi:hypothetical protein